MGSRTAFLVQMDYHRSSNNHTMTPNTTPKALKKEQDYQGQALTAVSAPTGLRRIPQRRALCSYGLFAEWSMIVGILGG